MKPRFVRKWKVKSAAWAGVVAGAVAGPLAYALILGSSEPNPRQAPVRTVASTPIGVSRSEESAVALAPRGEESVEDLMRTAQSSSADLRTRTQAVARIGKIERPAALHALVALAQEKRSGTDPNFVSLAALNALWVRGERGLVKELAEASPDPAVKSKAMALARMRAK